jgi:lipopolysaccharide/colanic/teichoic acid biosynthesis glycosyltransferase
MLDVVLALVALLALAPLLAVLAIAVKLHDRGPSLFWHMRVGRAGRPIRVPKFRTMHVDAEVRLHEDPALFEAYVMNGYKIPAALDPRISRLGRFLRSTSLDEFPQLWNVVKGEMSLVGPRPVVQPELSIYAERGALDHYLSLKPGLTGKWQVSGRSLLSIDERVALDLSYRPTVGQYLAVLFRTPMAVLRREGAH